MQKKTLGSILTLVGITVLLISLFADLLGIGGYPGIGWKQVVGIVIGFVIIVIGSYVTQERSGH
jgi:hypothetical protein